MSERSELIERQFVLAAAAVEGVGSALDFEPGMEGLPRRLPCVTMLYRGPRNVGYETGGIEVLEHTWTVRLYVDARTSWEKAERDLKQLVPRLLQAVRRNPSLDDSCEWAQLTEELVEPERLETGSLFVKRLRLTGRTLET